MMMNRVSVIRQHLNYGGKKEKCLRLSVIIGANLKIFILNKLNNAKTTVTDKYEK